jgi:NIPSNAP
MDRREFFSTAVTSAAIAGASANPLGAAQTSDSAREYYELRKYHLTTPQRKLADDFLRTALVPGLNRLGISPVGVFGVSIGPEGPSIYVLMPSASVETLATAETRLAGDAEYMKAGAEFLNASSLEPTFVRMESSLLRALTAYPKLVVPPVTAQKGARMFELRTYESASDRDHKTKVDQVNSGEVAIFNKSGFWPVFFGDALIGGKMPNLTYMIGFANLAERDKCWSAFFSAPETKTLFALPKYSAPGIVSNVNNTILTPAAYSQI